MLRDIDEIFTTNGNSALIDALNDAFLSSHIADYQICLRVAEQDAARYQACNNERMERVMRDNISYYRNRIAALESQLSGVTTS